MGLIENSCNKTNSYRCLGPERLERANPYLIVETKVNGDSKSSNERGPFLVGSLGLSSEASTKIRDIDVSTRRGLFA